MSKKMFPYEISSKKTISKSALSEILQYEPPCYKENGAGSYIEFRAFDPEKGAMRRKTIKLNRIKNVKTRRQYAKDLLKKISAQLQNGWNPWIAKDISQLSLFSEAMSTYDRYLDKMHGDGLFRKETYVGYKSYMRNLLQYIECKNRIYYVYQFDRNFCSSFLDYIFIDRDNCAQTRNNYLMFLKVLSSFLVDKGLLKSKPTDGIHPISKKFIKKTRTEIPSHVISAISDHLRQSDPYFLTACYLLYYCFIRPVEMTRLRIRDFNIKTSTLTISSENSKNRETQTVTIPKKVLLYMLDLKIFSAPNTDFIFSDKLMPGKTPIDTKIFRDHWAKVRNALNLEKQWQFYSLKDSGITALLDNNITTKVVRDQARHSTISITEIYDKKHKGTNSEIFNYDGIL